MTMYFVGVFLLAVEALALYLADKFGKEWSYANRRYESAEERKFVKATKGSYDPYRD